MFGKHTFPLSLTAALLLFPSLIKAMVSQTSSTTPNAATSTTTTPLSGIKEILSQMGNPYAQYYPENWPFENPFHPGEVKMQQNENVHHLVMKYAPKVIRPYMPDQHREFYVAQPFMVAAARDKQGNMWSTMITNPTGEANLLTSPDPQTLVFHGLPVPGDALYGAMQPGTDLGLLGIEFATKRRNRVNGRIVASSSSSSLEGDGNEKASFVFHTDQSFGNCPQYIKPLRWWSSSSTTNKNSTQHNLESSTTSFKNMSSKLSPEQMLLVSEAETIFVATGYRGEGSDVRYGNDASHRGGPKGFVMVQDESTIILPEFSGNNHFNSLGNLEMDNRMGITIPVFEQGGMLQLSGWAEVNIDRTLAATTYPGALRLITFHVKHVNVLPAGSLPVRWSPAAEAQSRQLQVASIVQESKDVKSFYLQPLPQDRLPSLWSFQPGQHLPIQLLTPDGELLRTYSLSGSPEEYNQYRISVKHQPFGKASSFLHEKVKVGDVIPVSRPAGDFFLDTKCDKCRTMVLISSGIGVTPLLSMMHHFADTRQDECNRSRQVIWIHGARNEHYHPFKGEVESLKEEVGNQIITHVRYSQPLDKNNQGFDSTGRIDLNLLESLVPDMMNADLYVCGSGSFMADIEEMLSLAGVDSRRIRSESF